MYPNNQYYQFAIEIMRVYCISDHFIMPRGIIQGCLVCAMLFISMEILLKVEVAQFYMVSNFCTMKNELKLFNMQLMLGNANAIHFALGILKGILGHKLGLKLYNNKCDGRWLARDKSMLLILYKVSWTC